MPHCYTGLEELIDTFGGPWLFGVLSVLILLFIVQNVARMKFVGTGKLTGHASTHIDKGGRLTTPCLSWNY